MHSRCHALATVKSGPSREQQTSPQRRNFECELSDSHVNGLDRSIRPKVEVSSRCRIFSVGKLDRTTQSIHDLTYAHSVADVNKLVNVVAFIEDS